MSLPGGLQVNPAAMILRLEIQAGLAWRSNLQGAGSQTDAAVGARDLAAGPVLVPFFET